MKFSDVVSERFRGPTFHDFSTWLKKVELAFRVTRTDEASKVDVLLALWHRHYLVMDFEAR